MAQLIQIELSDLIIKRVKDPSVQGVTVTEVQVSPDLGVAWVYIATTDEKAAHLALDGLKRASAFLRRQVGQKLHLKRVPELRFRRDDALEQGHHIDAILRDINRGES